MTPVKIGPVEEILELYLAGYYPFDHPFEDYIYWHREADRPVIFLTDRAMERAQRIARRIRPSFDMAENQAFHDVVALLGRDEIKANSWVRGGVARMYRQLHAKGWCRTIEAYRGGELAGALLEIELPGVVLAETMFSLEPDASKACLCYAVEKYRQLGFHFIDVQMEHAPDHPASRIGETTLPIGEYVPLLRATVREWAKFRS